MRPGVFRHHSQRRVPGAEQAREIEAHQYITQGGDCTDTRIHSEDIHHGGVGCAEVEL